MAQNSDADALRALSLEKSGMLARNGNYFYLSLAAAVVYDHLSTVDLEIELIWKKKWSLIQCLYFVNRYVGDASFIYGTAVFILVPDTQFAKIFQTWLSVISLMAMQAIYINRVMCMYRHKKKVVVSLLLGFSVNTMVAIILVGFSMQVVNAPIYFTPSIRTCVPTNFPGWTLAMWFPVMAFDLAIFLLAAREGLRYRHQNTYKFGKGIIKRGGWEGTLFQILLRDSIIFPFISMTVVLFNILAWYVLPVGSFQYTINIAAASSPILGCRLILHLRDAYYRPFSDEFKVDIEFPESVTGSMPQFALTSIISPESTIPAVPPRP